MKYLSILGIGLLLTTGCVMTKMLIPDVSTRMSQRELSHKEAVATKTQDQLVALLESSPLKDDKSKLKMGNLIYKAGQNADDIAPSATENIMQQYVRMQGQAALDKQLDAGFEWTTRTIGEVAGGSVGGAGVLGLLFSFLRKKRALGVVSSELTPKEKAKIKMAMNHTNLEKELT